MLIVRITGYATATSKHPSMSKGTLLVARELDLDFNPVGDPLLVIDQMGTSTGQQVIISSDGKSVRNALQDDTSPVRWRVIGQLTTKGVHA